VRHVSNTVGVMYLGQLTEVSPSDELFTAPRHPYTGALLSAVPLPDPDKSAQRQQIILVGDVPSPIAPPSGCRFHPRCPKAAPVCVSTEPALEPRLGDGPEHVASCHLPMAVGENLADFHPTIDVTERVIEGGGLLSGNEAAAEAAAAEAIPDAKAEPSATQPEGSKQ
jgi:oligopeptide/dipeptide ABC transporter ATP-binding protein